MNHPCDPELAEMVRENHSDPVALRIADGYRALNACGHYGPTEFEEGEFQVRGFVPINDVPDPQDFLSCIPENCQCRDDQTCIVCCTQRDLMAFIALEKVSIEPIRNKRGEFVVSMPLSDAVRLGIFGSEIFNGRSSGSS